MPHADLFDVFGQRLAAAEQRFEDAKAELFKDALTADELAERRAVARNLEAALGQMHETRRQMNDLRRSAGARLFDVA